MRTTLIIILLSLSCGLLSVFSCSRREISVVPEPGPDGGLDIMLNAGDDREARLESLHVMFYDSEDGELVGHYDINEEDLSEQGGSVTIIEGLWKTAFAEHETCDVYVIANWHEAPEDDGAVSLNQQMSLDGLMDLMDRDAHLNSPDEYGNLSSLTMSGVLLGWKPMESPDVCVLSVPLTRLAAKIEVNLYSSEENAVQGTTLATGVPLTIGGQTYTVKSIGFQLVSHATVSPVFESEEPVRVPNKGLMTGAAVDSKTGSYTCYSYSNDWESDIVSETYILVNLDLDPQKHYYRIPLRSPSAPQCLERNHRYEIKALITVPGSTDADRPVPLEEVEYVTGEWVDETVTVGDEEPRYLELSETDVAISAAESGADGHVITFASSSPIASVTVENVYYYNQYGRMVKLENDGSSGSTFTNGTYGVDIDIAYDAGVLNGTLTVSSNNPLNKTVRYIELTVTNRQGMGEKVYVRHYPLEYIVGVSGLYSYMVNDRRYTEVWPDNLSGELTLRTADGFLFAGKIPEAIQEGLDGHVGHKEGENTDMKCKFYLESADGEDGRIYRIDYSYSGSSYAPKYLADNGSASNNQMYHVVITSTSDDYVLARPIMEPGPKGDFTNEADDPREVVAQGCEDFVSPSFMLASQLGNSSGIDSWEKAQAQCQNYIEVHHDGVSGTVYDDWRLPTAAEIKIIAEYQSDGNVNINGDAVHSVMDKVLNRGNDDNPYYWISKEDRCMKILSAGNGSGEWAEEADFKDADDDAPRVRCIRDVRITDK